MLYRDLLLIAFDWKFKDTVRRYLTLALGEVINVQYVIYIYYVRYVRTTSVKAPNVNDLGALSAGR